MKAHLHGDDGIEVTAHPPLDSTGPCPFGWLDVGTSDGSTVVLFPPRDQAKAEEFLLNLVSEASRLLSVIQGNEIDQFFQAS
jgi:hypothetical protein